jgi:penicillin-binding protein 1A
MLKKLFLFFIVLSILAGAVGAGVLYWLVVLHPGKAIEPENIRRILGKESPVFYNDGKTRLGVFFDEAHRQYVPFNRIPKDFVNALVASEDEKFFSHFGFDPIGIIRAAIKNLIAGRVVEGGSTITQQTAKNLFKRTKRSFSAKLKELLYALRLEHRYSKQKIFEFYANQFYVSGNALGLGVAARYYFNKKPEDLTLVECAFIAGSVKRPNYYNPFIQKTEKSAELARIRAKGRAGYVLGKMLKLKMISKERYDKAVAQDIDFDKGKIGYSLDYVMEIVREAVSSSEVLDALAAHDITNLATSGVHIITTVDKDMQDKTLYSLRHELSRLDVRLNGYERDEVQKELKGVDYEGDKVVKERAYLFGTIIKKTVKGNDISVDVEFDDKLGEGVIDRQGLGDIVDARVKWQHQAWTEASDKDYIDLLKQLKDGDRVWVTVRSLEPGGKVLLDLEKYPEVEGGALVMKNGQIQSVAGGVENRFYNRAVYAKRTMGSSFKPFVFAAALQLGWNAIDPLANVRDVFVFQGQPYFPRPDHISPFPYVSMSWAGVESENLAAVWLTYHLCDKLNESQFKEVAAHVGLAPQVNSGGEQESYNSYKTRIRDKYGIVVTNETLQQAAFYSALANSEADFIFEGKLDDYKALRRLHYGEGFDDFKAQIEKELGDDSHKLAASDKRELLLREKLLSKSFLSLQALKKELGQYRREVEGEPTENVFGSVPDTTSLFNTAPKIGILCYDKAQNRYSYELRNDLPEGMIPVAPYNLQQYLLNQDESVKQKFWDNVYIQSTVSVAALDMLQEQIKTELARLQKLPSYSLDVLSSVKDFRVLVGLEYLIKLGGEMGIKSNLDPVLSFPLGSNVVTLLEETRMYEGLVTGAVPLYGEQNEDNGDLLTIIDRIEDASGEVLYRPKKTVLHPVDPQTSLAIGDILENVIKFGTGRYADKHVRMRGKDGKIIGLPVPLLGKTGTANMYTNAAFLGYLPGGAPTQKGEMALPGGYTVGSYVGFDDNKTMRRHSTKVTGAVGALPIWTDIVNALLQEQGFGKQLDMTPHPQDNSTAQPLDNRTAQSQENLAAQSQGTLTAQPPENPVTQPPKSLVIKRDNLGQINVAVSADDGGLFMKPGIQVDEHARYTPSVMTFGRIDDSGDFEAKRSFTPFWRSVTADEATKPKETEK